MKVRSGTSIGALLLPLAAVAQTDTLRQELEKCSTIADVTARVTCYDALSRPEPAKARVTAPAPPKADTFGQPKARVESNDKGEEALLSTVASFKELQPNKLQITLANGQVWQQMVGKSFFLRTNDTVRIVGTGWGRSYRLAVDGRPDFIQVSRLR